MLAPRSRLVFGVVFALLLGPLGCNDEPGDGGADWPVSQQRQWVSGSVLDLDAAPIAGAQVRLGELTGTTDDAGRYGFATFAGQVTRALVVNAPGYLPVERRLPAGGGARIELPPLMLFEADGTVTIEGRDGGRLLAEGVGIEVTVPARAFSGSVTLRTARVPLGDPLRDELRLPAPLPRQANDLPVAPLFALLLDAGGAQPSVALTVAVTSDAGLPAGTRVPVGRFDEAAGEWVDAGQAVAAADGKLRFTTGHLSSFGAALPALPADETVAPDLGTMSRAISPFRPGEPRLDPRSGAVQVGFSLPPLWRRGEPVQPALFYDSRTVRPVLSVPVAAPDANAGEGLIARVTSELGQLSTSFTVTEAPTGDASPAMVVETEAPEVPAGIAQADHLGELEPLKQEVETGSYTAGIQIVKPTAGVLTESASGSFTDVRPGPILRDADDEPLPAPQPVELRRSDQLAVAVDNRSQSAFGPGWQVEGLTRLVQPWCTADRATLAGERDHPAVTFGASAEPELRPLAEVLVAAGKERDDLRNSLVAVSGGKLYVALAELGEVWQLSPGGTDPVLFAGGGQNTLNPGEGEATELQFGYIVAISEGPRGQGILLATEDYISHILPDGTATRVAGTGNTSGNTEDIREGESPLSSTFCGWLAFGLAADPTSDRFVFSMMGGGLFEVVDDKLNRVRTRISSPHWLFPAFDPQGTLHYASDTGFCIYRHEDGLTDPMLFPRCTRAGEEPLEDGPAETAMAGTARALAFDSSGTLWFVDGQYHVLRRYSPGGELVTVTLPPAPGTASTGTVPGALIGSAVLGAVNSMALTDPLHLYLGGATADDLCTTAPLAPNTLTAMGSGDGSLLVPLDVGGGWMRVLESGWVERYDARGLLLSRGQPGEVPIDYVYQGDWALSIDDEVCGRPQAPPPLARIELAGEALWRFEYRDGQLHRITDAAGRTVTRTAASDGDRFALPGGATVAVSYDEDGRIVEKSAPGPGGADRWQFAWTDGRLSSWTDPAGHSEEIEAAEASVAVPADEFDLAGVAEDAEARIPTADLPTSDGERAKLVLGDHGVTLTSPAGDETTLTTDAFGRLLRVTQPDGSTLQISRDAVGRIVGLHNESLGESWRYRYGRVLANSGQPYLDERLVERIDPLNRRTSWRYSATGALVERTDPAGTTRMQVATTGAARGLPTQVIDGARRQIQVVYDERGNMTRIAVVDPDDAEPAMVTEIERDSAGRAVRVVEPSGRVVRSEYEPWGEVTRHTVGDAADGHSLLIERAATAAWAAVGGDRPQAPITRAVDGEGKEWRLVYQAGWRLGESWTTAAGREAFTHDARGRLIERALADGSREELTLGEDDGRIDERRWFGPASGAQVAFEFDERGRVSEMRDPLRRELREYEPGFGWSRHLVQPVGQAPDEAGFEITRRRNRVGVEATVMDSQRAIFERGFDGRYERVTRGPVNGGYGDEVLTYDYDGARRLTTVVRGNGTRSELLYDALGRVVLQREHSAAGTSEIAYSWDGDRPASRSRGGVTRSFGYDGQGRLASCSDTGETYGYDRSGAISSAGGQAVVRDAAGRLTSDGSYQYQYDLLGRRVERVALADASDRTVYEYGPAGRLARVLVGAAGAETELARYAYDGSGRRVERVTADGSWLTGYLPDSERPVRLREPDGTVWQLLHATPDAAWSAAFADDGRERYTHLDAFSRVIGVSDEDGALIWLDDSCYGAPLTPFSPGGPPIVMHGMAYDAETGLILAGARYYDPAVGEFLSPDPRGIAGGTAAYGYADGNPILAQDPDGRFLLCVGLGALAVGGLILNEVRKATQSDDAKRTRRGYDRMTDVATDDDALGEAERAHKDLAKTAVKAGEVAVKSTVKGYQAVTNPTDNFKDAAEAGMDLAESAMEEGTDGAPPEDE